VIRMGPAAIRGFGPESQQFGAFWPDPEISMRRFCRFGLFLMPLLAIALFAAAGQRAALAASFDGSWSVVIITDNGTCDRAYRYPVRVVNGEIRYEGEAGIAISGRVDGSGKLNATISRGEQSASGTGRLSRASGSGTWSGKSKTSACSGRWEAERREG
jgi:hypothetical protein